MSVPPREITHIERGGSLIRIRHSDNHFERAGTPTRRASRYAGHVLTLVAAPANNERGPRYMEKALASIHQSGLHRPALTLMYGAVGEHIGLLLRCPNAVREIVLGPVIANYPHCSYIDIPDEPIREDWQTFSVDLFLVPELLPILRHAQFEDALNRTFADPVSSLLRSIKPDGVFDCGVEIHCLPASHRRCHAALKSVKRLNREFFRHRHRIARYYARHILRGPQWPIAWLLGLIAAGTPLPHHSLLETSTSRLHDREEDL